jgi:formylglycine-generating enzyme required for sulfatase activity
MSGLTRRKFMIGLAVTTPLAIVACENLKPKAFTEALNLPNGAVPLEMALIPKGKFTMGSPSSEEERENRELQHEVNFPQDFYMSRYAVTQAQWLVVMGKFTHEFDESADTKFKGDNRPMIYVRWHEAREFCKRLTATLPANRGTYRLPTEAEWEYACRAGTTTPFHFGETITPSLVNYNHYRQQIVDVNSFSPNAWGLHQMHGNVWEWCLDQYFDSYNEKSSNLKNNGSEPYGGMNVNDTDNRYLSRLLRGGSWNSVARRCRAAYRDGDIAQKQVNYIGFRLLLASSL